MWISEQSSRRRGERPGAEEGVVTLGGDPAGVFMGGERRWVQVYSPGGYQWRPGQGDRVLILKAGAEGETPCVAGRRQEDGDLEPGEVRLTGGTGAVRLNSAGVELQGQVLVNGVPLEQLIRSIAGK